MAELVKLRQEQQNTRAQLKAMEQRLQGTEHRQQQMMAFSARAMRNPNFLQQLVQQREKWKELEEALSKKRQRPIDQFAHSYAGTSRNNEEQQQYFYAASELEDFAMEMQGFENDELNEQQEEVELEEALSKKRRRPIDQFAHSDAGTSRNNEEQYFYAALELEDFAMEMQGFENDELNKQQEEVDVELNDEFWQELLNDGICEEKGKTEMDETGLRGEGLVIARNNSSGSH